MLKLSEAEIIERIQTGQTFECEIDDGSFAIKIDSYAPSVCMAIHAGHNFRRELLSKCALDDDERLYEEDPHTCQMIQAMPITVVANDSRYEYDLNRPIATCIYNKVWDKTVWKRKLTKKESQASIEKHQRFYRVLDVLTTTIERRFGAALIFDIHSYNYLGLEERVTPTFNIGTEQLDRERWKDTIELALNRLGEITLPNLPVVADENIVFSGRGYLASHINARLQNTLVLPLEIKKIFMDELSGEIYPLVMQELVHQFKDSIVDISTFFARRYTRKHRAKKIKLLAEKMEPAVAKVDSALYKIAKGLDSLHYINPINIPGERKRFFKSHGNYQPEFIYRQLNIDPYLFRESLYRLPVNDIRDPGIQALYRDVIDNLSEKIDLLVKAGKPNFLYESLKYFGEPSLVDKQNANFILHAASFGDEEQATVTTEELISRFKQTAEQWGMECKIESSSKLVASAMVSNSKKTVFLGKNLLLTESDATALIHHELGVHMATRLNAGKQRLKVFTVGLPGSTLTQEGLAILNEYHSGNMTLKRLKILALRVLAVDEMIKQGDFRHTYNYLHEEQRLTPDEAFKLAVRVHRGGGFTKDYLYLNGICQALHTVRKQNLRNLYVGKTGFDYLNIINEMVERQWVSKPQFYPQFLQQPVEGSPVLEYLISCIKPTETIKQVPDISSAA
jgi:uncharacterized protein (TIGR02421 family)